MPQTEGSERGSGRCESLLDLADFVVIGVDTSNLWAAFLEQTRQMLWVIPVIDLDPDYQHYKPLRDALEVCCRGVSR